MVTLDWPAPIKPKPTITHAERRAALYKAARSYARLGWPVLPLHTIKNGVCTCSKGAACTSPGKHPLFKGGVHSATLDLANVRRIWRDNPDANIGIATGSVSSIVAIDIDPRNGGRDTARARKERLGGFKRTPTSATGGGGLHYLVAYPVGGIATIHGRKDLRGIDIQSDGAFIVAPPSRHVSGKTYRWCTDKDPAAQPLAALPPAWLDFLKQTASPPPVPTTAGATGTIAEGGRNSHLASRAGALQNTGLRPEAILAALMKENEARCSPPLDQAEVERIAASIGRYPAGTPGGDEAEAVMNAVLNQHFAGGAHLLHPSDGQFWSYDGKRWAPLPRPVLRGIALTEVQAMPAHRGQTASLTKQVVTLLEARVAAKGDPLRFLADPLPVINCRNGELWIKDDGLIELRPHSHASYLRHCLDIDYDPGATCPQYDRAMLEIFSRSPGPRALVLYWHELMGYAIQSRRKIPIVILVWGRGNDGKTKLLATLVRLIGHELIVAMPIQNLEKSQFTIGNLLGKLLVLDDDVQSGTRLPDGQLKRFSEEKAVTGEIKFGSPFTFMNRTVTMMLFNNPPSLTDLSYGMQRRLHVVPFKRTFTEKEDDRELFDRIWATELPGVLNRYLEGLARVIKGGWTIKRPEAVVAETASLLKAANPLPSFIDEFCERSGSVLLNPLYEKYGEWAKGAGITFSQQRLSFKRNLESLGFKVVHSNQGAKVVGLQPRARPHGQPRSP